MRLHRLAVRQAVGDTRAVADIAAMKQQARATWAAGDFDSVVPFIWEAGTAAAEASTAMPAIQRFGGSVAANSSA
jgi:hypothetical protein